MTTEVDALTLRDCRRAKGYTLDELALLAAISPSVLSRAERGERNLSPHARVRVMRALELDARTARGISELVPNYWKDIR
jgi:transcriptional regulator with XRE-family HTH domain